MARLRGTAALQRAHLRQRHAERQQPLARRRQQAGITRAAHGDEFVLRRRPCGHPQLRQRLPGRDHIARRQRPHPLHEARGAALHHRHRALVQTDDTACFDVRAQRNALHRGQPHPQALGEDRIDLHAALPGGRVRSFVGVARHQFHVHERRLAGPLETLLRVHGVVPVQHLAPGARGIARRAGRSGRFGAAQRPPAPGQRSGAATDSRHHEQQ